MITGNNILTDYSSLKNGITSEHWLSAIKHGFDFKNHTYPSLWDKSRWRYKTIINDKEIVFRMNWERTANNKFFIYADACYFKPNDTVPFSILSKAVIIDVLNDLTTPD